MPHAVSAVGLERRFGELDAVAGVDLAVPEGEIYGFLGPNGAGKSTTIRMLCTLLLPSAGSARVAGYDVVSQVDEVRLRIGVALQEAALDPKLSGRELLYVQGRLYGLRSAEIAQRIDELAGLLDTEALDRRIGGYSGGMKRRLDLAAALMHRPRVLFLDEPTTGLDPTSRLRVWEEVRRLNAELGVTIFLTTQYLEEADALADRLGIIHRGRIAAEGAPAELKRHVGADVIVVRVGAGADADAARESLARLPGVEHCERYGDELTLSVRDGASAISPVAVALSQAGIPVEDLTLRTPTLDDVFQELTGGRMGAEP